MHSTGFGSGVAVPHGKSACVKQPFVLFARKAQAIDWKASDGEDVNCWICLGVPQSGEEDQVKIIGTLCRKIIHKEFIHQQQQGDTDRACLVKSNPQLIRKWRWSHPTYCRDHQPPRRDRSHLHGGGSPEQKARSLGHTIKVETQGSSGVENRLSSEEIAAADYVILATGRGLSGDDRARFAGKKVYEIAISGVEKISTRFSANYRQTRSFCRR